MTKRWSPYVYFARLHISNVKAFGEAQELDLRDPKTGRPSQWTLILGDNGVGKTTLLQCAALMRPVLSVEPNFRADAPYPDWLQPALAFEENANLVALARVGAASPIRLEADLLCGRRLNGPGGRGRLIHVHADIEVSDGELMKFATSEEGNSAFTLPLIIGYSAARHMAFNRGDTMKTSEDATSQLFEPEIQLEDAEDVLERLDYASARKDGKSARLLRHLKAALAKVLPDISRPEDIKIYPPATPVSTKKTGVRFVTPYGEVPFRSLSLGYQTVAAWTADLAWKLFKHYPKSQTPLEEPAIVLIDEIDLHLHPHWQRIIRQTVSASFPQVQFIATAHSPLMAQNYLDTNIVVLTRRGESVHIENDPAVLTSWGVDEVVTSELFGLTSPYAPPIDDMFRERAALLRLARRTRAQRMRLEELQVRIGSLPTEDDAQDQKVLDHLRIAAALVSV